MTTSAAVASPTTPHDEDLAEQAVLGHGVPSQDPDPEAQVPLAPGEAEREADSVLTGGGVVGGAVVGAAIGVVVGGPVGVVVGGTLGAVAGAVGGIAAGKAMNAGESDTTDPADPAPAPLAHTSSPTSLDKPALAVGTKP